MMHKLTFRAMLLSGVCLVPLGAMGADLGAAPAAPGVAAAMTSDNEIDFGLMGIGGTNTGQYGRYNGFTEQGADGLFGFSSVTRDAWDSGGTRYYIFTGSDINFQFGDILGNAGDPNGPGGRIKNFSDGTYSSQTANDLGPDASVRFNVGDQGHWGVIGYYDAISYTGNIIDSIYTINGHTGTLNGGLSPWGGPTSYTSLTPAQLATAEQSYQVGTRRDIVGLTGTYQWNDWTVTAAVRHEHKEGTLEESFDGAAGGVAFTLPIDYDTERYDVSASYSTPQLQAQLAYFLSNFTDNNNGVLLPDPFAGKAGSPLQQTALYSTPPSNFAQYVTAMVGYNLTPGTRINVNARYGVETQNDTYPANTGDPLVAGTPGGQIGLNALGQGTSATSPNIIAQVYQGNVGISSNPISGLNASAKYSIDGRNVSIDQVGGVLGSGSGADSSTGVLGIEGYVVPQEWLKQKVNLDADYRILPQSDTKLTLGYQYDDIDRSNAQVGHSSTNTLTAGLSSMMGSAFMGRINYTYADRTGVMDYWTAWQNLTAGSSAYGPADTPSGAYYQAPMTSNAINLRGDYSPGGAFSGGLQFKFENDDFHYPSTTAGTPAGTLPANLQNQVYGITQDNNLTAGIDANYRPVEGVNLHAYYTYEEIFYNNLGNGACSGSNAPPLCTGSVGYFQNKQTTDVQTVGLSADWQATDRLKLTGQYTFAYGSVMFGEYNGVFVAAPNQNYQNVINYPDDHTIMNALSIKGSYKLTENVELSVGGMYSMFLDKDWRDLSCAVEPTNGICTGPGAGTSISILTPGYSSPNYNVGAVMAMLKVKW